MTKTSKIMICPKCNGRGNFYDSWSEILRTNPVVVCDTCDGNRMVTETIKTEVSYEPLKPVTQTPQNKNRT